VCTFPPPFLPPAHHTYNHPRPSARLSGHDFPEIAVPLGRTVSHQPLASPLRTPHLQRISHLKQFRETISPPPPPATKQTPLSPASVMAWQPLFFPPAAGRCNLAPALRRRREGAGSPDADRLCRLGEEPAHPRGCPLTYCALGVVLGEIRTLFLDYRESPPLGPDNFAPFSRTPCTHHGNVSGNGFLRGGGA